MKISRGIKQISKFDENYNTFNNDMLKKNNDYILYYSIDGDSYVKVRQFYIPNAVPEIAIGAFFCSPKRSGLVVGLEKVEFF